LRTRKESTVRFPASDGNWSKARALFGCGRVGPANLRQRVKEEIWPEQVPEGTDPVQQSRQLWLAGIGRTRSTGWKRHPRAPADRARHQEGMPTQRLAARKLDEILSRINDCAYNQLASQRWPNCGPLARGSSRQSETVNGAIRQLPSRLSHSSAAGEAPPRPGGPENQQVFVNQLAGASRKTVLNILSTLSSCSRPLRIGIFERGDSASQACAPRKKCPRSRTFHPFPSRIDSSRPHATAVAHVL